MRGAPRGSRAGRSELRRPSWCRHWRASPHLPWLCRSLLHHAASARRGQNRAAAREGQAICRYGGTALDQSKMAAIIRRRPTPSRRRLDRRHLEGVHVAVFAADRDIFAVAKRVVAEAIAGLVVVLRGLVIGEHPARVLG